MHQKNIKVLVTGGAGYVGSHTVVALARSGYVPIIVDNFINSKLVNIQRIERLIKQPLKVYQSDCKDEKSLVKIFALEKNVAGVIHFAGFKSVRESMLFPQAYYMNNLGAMNTVLGLSKRMGVKYFILSSSCTVYGIQRRLPVDEKVVWGTAQSPYGLIKQASERMLAKTCRGSTWLKGIALRYFNPIGAHPSGTLGEDSLSKFQNFVPVLMRVAAGEIKKVAMKNKRRSPYDLSFFI